MSEKIFVVGAGPSGLAAAWRLKEQGFQPVTMSVTDTENFVKADVERWAKVIRDAGIKAD